MCASTAFVARTSGRVLGGYLDGVDLNTLGDNQITIGSPNTNYRVAAVVVSNASISLSAAQIGVFTATGGSGFAVVSTATALSGITATAANTAANALSLSINTAWLNVRTLYLRVTTAQGAPATADFYIYIEPLP